MSLPCWELYHSTYQFRGRKFNPFVEVHKGHTIVHGDCLLGFYQYNKEIVD